MTETHRFTRRRVLAGAAQTAIFAGIGAPLVLRADRARA